MPSRNAVGTPARRWLALALLPLTLACTPVGARTEPPTTVQLAAAESAPTTTEAPAPPSAATTGAIETPAPTPALTSAPAPRSAGEAVFSGQQAWQHVDYLANAIGSRVAGSPAARRAADYLVAQLIAAGLPAEQQPFDFSAYEDRGSSVELVGPPDAPAVRPQTMSFSPAGEVEGELVEVGLARTGDFEPQAVRGKLALAQRGETRFGEKVATLAAAGATGVLITNNQPGTFAGSLGGRGEIPTVALSQADGEQLAALLQRGPVRVRLRVKASLQEKTGLNVVAGQGAGRPTVVIGAHYDSVAAGPGANDNGSGVATLLELARVVGQRSYPFNVRFACFDAEEVGLFGSAAYVRQLTPAARSDILAMINLDMVGVGDRLKFGGDTALVDLASSRAGELDQSVSRLHGGPAGASSDHASFQNAGVPALFVYRSDDPNYHTAEDRAEQVRPEHLQTAGAIVLGVLDALAQQQR